DGLNGLDNIKLLYEFDTNAPYDCEGESYIGSETQFGSTDTTGFSSADGTSVFTDSVGISTTQALCVYVVLDVLKAASGGSTIDVGIAQAATDVLISGSASTTPRASVAVAGATSVKLNTDFKIQRGVSTLTGDTLTLTAGVDYEAPISASSSFIRITNTGYTGAGRNTGGGTSNAKDVTVYITNPSNIASSITFQRGPTAVNNTRVSWEIIEYQGVAGGENEMIVRSQQPLTYVSGNTTVNSAAIPTVADDTDAVVFITSQFNPDTAAASYHLGISTAAWNGVTDLVTLTRGASGNAAIASYALVEFTGSNWKVQRAEHLYSAVGSAQTEAITAVNSLGRTF
ncbi:MAG: hypothetical protein Q7T74_04165, partial [Candidatus Saccharibacteria bacterium]|nr:hypothetical protein [Candidatus Saccharibacteria bacterium]